MSAAPVHWRWDEQDFGFRFRVGSGASAAEHYQAAAPGDFHLVPANQRKLPKARADALDEATTPPTAPRVVPNPWTDYDRDWDWIVGPNGIVLNYAGCLDQEEIHRREDAGVARANEFVIDLAARPEPAPLTVPLTQQVHRALLGEMYPFAGTWRTVALHKGDGPTNAAEVMGEFIAIHPFREGNGRTAFMLGNLVLMQNDLLPLDVYDQRRDQDRYFTACEAVRIQKDYEPLAALIEEWEAATLTRWEGTDGPA